MTKPNQTTLQCSNCGTPNAAVIRRVIDVQRDPQGKAQLLSGQINQFQCSNCGMVNSVSSPLLYHDASKEMLVAFVPMDVAMQSGQNDEQIIGGLLNELTASLPKNEFKGYMLGSPKRALTMQGMIEQILEADGISQEMLETQRGRVDLLQKMIEAPDRAALEAIATENDAKIDANFFQTMSMMLQQLLQQGQQQIAERMVDVQDVLLETTSYGRELREQEEAQEDAINEVAQAIRSLTEDATVDDFLDVVAQYAEDESRLRAVVALARPALDYQFFTVLTERIDVAEGDEKTKLETMRDQLQAMTETADAQMRIAVQQKVQFLQALMQTDDIEAMLQANAPALDDNFMTVLQANLQEAERRSDLVNAAKLREIYDISVKMLQAQMTPALRFLNDLLNTEDAAGRKTLIQERAADYDKQELMDTVDAVSQMLAAQGQEEAVTILSEIRETVVDVLG